MTEASVYDKDGLFHSICKASAIMNGRYAVLPNGSVDLNAGNVISGLDIPKEKYPIVACLPPVSVLEPDKTGWECFYFRLLFLCTSGYTGDNKVKFNDKNTNASLHKTSLDWNDMKNVAFGFLAALQKIKPSQLQGKFTLLQGSPIRFTRVSNALNDRISGVMMQFEARLFIDCEYTDIVQDDIELTFEEHIQHFH